MVSRQLVKRPVLGLGIAVYRGVPLRKDGHLSQTKPVYGHAKCNKRPSRGFGMAALNHKKPERAIKNGKSRILWYYGIKAGHHINSSQYCANLPRCKTNNPRYEKAFSQTFKSAYSHIKMQLSKNKSEHPEKAGKKP